MLGGRRSDGVERRVGERQGSLLHGILWAALDYAAVKRGELLDVSGHSYTNGQQKIFRLNLLFP